MLGGADKSNGDLGTYITGADKSHPTAGGVNKIAATTLKRAYNALPTGRYNDQHEIP
ncbi:hypothetical protein AB3M75_23655 [Serratia ureilytica]|uniref:hypothetical protein n=1 Tax=Serratia ureilytica TaxID=300181 RepID=UPI003720F244